MAYSSVSELIDSLDLDGEVAKELKGRIAQQGVSTTLSAYRTLAGFSQKDLAEVLGWTEKQLSNFEELPFDEINLKDFVEFICALDLEDEKRLRLTEDLFKALRESLELEAEVSLLYCGPSTSLKAEK